MARPWRRVVINIACKLGISYREVETWDMETIREHIWVLTEMQKPSRAAPPAPAQMSERELESRFRVHLDSQPEG